MNCRVDIIGKKIWIDDNNKYNTRPNQVQILLFKDYVLDKSSVIYSLGSGEFAFNCLVAWQNNTHKYVYTVDEAQTPLGYNKIIDGFNIINVLQNITIQGTKTWLDNNNEYGARPSSVTLRLLQNLVQIDSIVVDSPPDQQSVVSFSFGTRPFADSNSVPYSYLIVEDSVQMYQTTVNGFDVVNTYHVPAIPFSFKKTSLKTGMSLEGGTFDILKNGIVKYTSYADQNGVVSFEFNQIGQFSLQESLPPIGFMDNTTVYNLDVSIDGTITIDGNPSEGFEIKNNPTDYGVILTRAGYTQPQYSNPPNAWGLHGEGENLFMTDKIIITPEASVAMVKWDYDPREISYFVNGGGNDITQTYLDGINIDKNCVYTVYVRFFNGYEALSMINVDNFRDGTTNLPFLLLDYVTASTIPRLNSFTMDFMQYNESRLSCYYELYQNIDFDGRKWLPLGANSLTGFSGGLHGNGNYIVNLSPIEGNYPLGLVSKLTNGWLESISIIDCNIQNPNNYASGFVGSAIVDNQMSARLKDLHFIGGLSSGSGVGAICSHIDVISGNMEIDGCTANAQVNCLDMCGGLIGEFWLASDKSSMQITNCSTLGDCYATNTGSVCGGIFCSAIADGISSLQIENCLNNMNIYGSVAGGLFGRLRTTNGAKISSSCNLGNIFGITRVGGIAGFASSVTQQSPIIIKDCYNRGLIEANCANITYVGGIIGVCETYASVINCYNAGNVSGNGTCPVMFVGGISANYGLIQNCVASLDCCKNQLSTICRIASTPTLSSNPQLANNYAIQDMEVLINGTQKYPLDIGTSNTDGENATLLQITSQSFYQNTLNWDYNTVWTQSNQSYPLPILTSIPSNLQPTTPI